MHRSILIKNGTLVPLTPNLPIQIGDLLIDQGRIAAIGRAGRAADVVIDAQGCAVLPGFVQTHVHLCQTIFRGAADDLALIDWLKQRVWPMEAAHSADSVRASAQLGVAELIKGGTTCALTMETVNHTDEVFRVVQASGFRATVGKCMMDKGDELPPALHEQKDESVHQSLALLKDWHGSEDGRIRYCFAPRFAVSCTRELLLEVAQLAHDHGVMIHTHASENRTECKMVETETGMRNIAYLDSLGLTGQHVVLAHCVHVNNEEIDILARTKTNFAHCPSSNLKLASGIAPVKDMLAHSVSVSLGADGGACNNRLDMFTEMRTAALLQKVVHGPEVLPASTALRMATIDGARAMGLDSEIGSLEVGKRADVIIVNLEALHLSPGPVDVISALVYAGEASDVETVIIDGQILMRDRELLTLNEREILRTCKREAEQLFTRAHI